MSFLKNILISSLVTITLASSLTCYADVAVNGYYKKDGTYVKPHMRSDPDNNFYNNWSTVGNINPYTGEKGNKTMPAYSQNAITTSYSGKLSRLYDENINSTVSRDVLAKPLNSQIDTTNLVKLKDYENLQSPSILRLKIDGVNWYQLAENKDDIAYVRGGNRGYFNNYPTISIMFKGSKQFNNKPAWLGTRFVKVIVDCEKDKIAVVADAVVASNGKVVSDIDYPQSGEVTWSHIDDSFDTNLFKSISRACMV